MQILRIFIAKNISKIDVFVRKYIYKQCSLSIVSAKNVVSSRYSHLNRNISSWLSLMNNKKRLLCAIEIVLFAILSSYCR